jgi:hypothetical protein
MLITPGITHPEDPIEPGTVAFRPRQSGSTLGQCCGHGGGRYREYVVVVIG